MYGRIVKRTFAFILIFSGAVCVSAQDAATSATGDETTWTLPTHLPTNPTTTLPDAVPWHAKPNEMIQLTLPKEAVDRSGADGALRLRFPEGTRGQTIPDGTVMLTLPAGTQARTFTAADTERAGTDDRSRPGASAADAARRDRNRIDTRIHEDGTATITLPASMVGRALPADITTTPVQDSDMVLTFSSSAPSSHAVLPTTTTTTPVTLPAGNLTVTLPTEAFKHPATPGATAPTTPTSPAATASLPTEAAAQPPKISGIPGGYNITFPTLTPIGGLAVRGELAGDYQIHFDTTPEKIDEPAQPVSDVPILIPLADYWIFRGKGERAIPLYERGLEKDPNNLLLQNNLAMLYSSVLEDHDKALAMIDKALEARPDHVTLLDTKALILLNAGRAFEAIPLLERAVELSCQGPIYVLHLAYALDAVGGEDRARDWFERVRPILEASPNKMLKENQDMFDALQMKYGAAF